MTPMQTRETVAEPSAYMSLKNVPRRPLTPTTLTRDPFSFEDELVDASDTVPCTSTLLSTELAFDEYTGRRDALPEHYAYRDEGCDLNPTCLACPLERCRYDDFRGITALRISEPQQRVVELRAVGWSASRVASELGVSRRTVFRLSSAS